MKDKFKFFTDPSYEEEANSYRILCLILLLAVVLAGWGFFLNWGSIPFDFHDWAEVNAPRLAFLKDAVTKGELPLHMPDSSSLRGVTDRFMALPDIILSPQVILLRWMPVGMFVLVHTGLLIVFGYWGLLKLKKRFSLSLLSFTWITLLYFFNGHMLSHYAVGHVTWGGAFLLSWFIELVFALIDGERGALWEAKMAFLLFFIFLQGSFHQFVWCVIFLGFLAVANWKLLPAILRSGIAAVLLSMVRIIPPALQMGAFDDEFLGGYRTPVQIVKAFVRIISPADSLDQAKTGAVLGWWEFDIYTGIAGLLVLILGIIAWLLLRNYVLGFPALICPVAVMSLFSVRSVYMLMRLLHIPLFSGERVSSRFLLLPVLFVLIAGTAALQQWLKDKGIKKAANTVMAILLIPVLVELWLHLNTWKVTEAFKAFPYTATDLSIKTVANHPDQPYTTGLLAGAAVSLISAVFLIIRAWREADREE